MKKLYFFWEGDSNVCLTWFAPTGEGAHPAILILPGGGYNTCAPGEGAPVAEQFAQMGYSAFVLNYSTRFPDFAAMHSGMEPNKHTVFPEPLRQVASAMMLIRSHAQQYGVNDNQIAVAGFSAGGHLASNYCSLWNTEEVYGGIAQPELLRPNGCILGYAATELTPDEIILPAVFGKREEYPAELRAKYTAWNHVSEATPPTFLFHSVTDPMVPSLESMEMAKALEQAGRPWELHMFGCGGHAFGLGAGQNAGAWVSLADAFLKKVYASPLEFDKNAVKAETEARFAAMDAKFKKHKEGSSCEK